MGKGGGGTAGGVGCCAYVGQGLFAAFAILGVHAELSYERVSKHPSAACFASSTQADLTSGGFKLIGSAQVWKDDALLQQGSLPLDDQSAEFFSMLRFPNEIAKEESFAQYGEKTTPLHTFVPGASWDDVAYAFQNGFSQPLQEDFVYDTFSPSKCALPNRFFHTQDPTFACPT